ncbi:MAG: tRNA (adenosine(37)-N6)-dimethylallyltransferase MiaA [Lentisphaeria bacterium]|nr:tRNA (adenosine(37)-N6)-dimethylallyltransferase MiaA [Lentisphaeria bacterium]
MIRVPLIMGATASGKSALALELARRNHGEIISADSMQIYRELDKGTAKPSPAELSEIPHHLVNILNMSERSDVFSMVSRMEQAVKEIRSRENLPVIAGGTGLYLRAFLYGMDDMPADQGLRKELDEQFDSPEGHETLKRIMEKECPADFARWKEHPRKLIRAREVFLLCGKEMTVLQKAWKERPPREDAVSFLLVWDREALNRRIFERCGEMLENGWIEETERLMSKGLFETPTAWQALGYSLIRDHLLGKIKRSELCERISIATRQFAKRQMTWFTGQHPEAIRIPMPCSMDQAISIIKSNTGTV